MQLNIALVENAVLSVCSYLDEQGCIKCDGSSKVAQNDKTVLERLFACILASQTQYSVAHRFAAELSAEEIRGEVGGRTVGFDSRFSRYFKILNDGISFGTSKRRYRFPRIGAHRCAAAATVASAEHDTFVQWKESLDANERVARKYLIEQIPGLGLKQASMFLRDIGLAKDLAVIDRHVYLYHQASRIGEQYSNRAINGAVKYLAIEEDYRDYSQHVGYPLALLDYSIWLTIGAIRNSERTLLWELN